MGKGVQQTVFLKPNRLNQTLNKWLFWTSFLCTHKLWFRKCLCFRFEFRDASDPHGFTTLTRDNCKQMQKIPHNGTLEHKISMINSCITHTTTQTGGQFTSRNTRKRIEGLSEVHQRETARPRSRGKWANSADPCYRCGLPLG